VQCFDYRDHDDCYVDFDTKAGEVLAQDIGRDGMMAGYDTTTLSSQTPVIRLGGCGNYAHMLQAFKGGADACAAGSLWSFTDSNPIRAKKWLANHGVLVRT
jgi:cyclase